MGSTENSNFNNIPSYFALGSIKGKWYIMEVYYVSPDRFHWGVIKFVDMTFSFCNYKLHKILLDFTKDNVRYHGIMIVVKGWFDLDLVPNIASTTRTLSNHARSSLMLKVINKLVN